jgi:hypothetical protein
MNPDPVSLAIISACGWIGLLARNYYTEMAAIAVERSRRDAVNEQERLNREREQFDIVFQNLLTRVNEERDVIQALLLELKQVIERSIDADDAVVRELISVRQSVNLAISSFVWNGEDRQAK